MCIRDRLTSSLLSVKYILTDSAEEESPYRSLISEQNGIYLYAVSYTHLHCMLLSNNKEPRVKMFNDAVNVSYIYKAGKPSTKNYLKAVEEMGTTTENTDVYKRQGNWN